MVGLITVSKIMWKLLKGIFTKNTKTTSAGATALLVALAKMFGVPIPEGVAESIITVCVFLIGLFSKDADNKDVPNIPPNTSSN